MVFINLICTVQDSKDIVLVLIDEEVLWRGKHTEEKDGGRRRRWRRRLSEIERGHCLSGGIRDKAQDKIGRGMRIGKLCLLYQGHCWQNMHTIAKEVTY